MNQKVIRNSRILLIVAFLFGTCSSTTADTNPSSVVIIPGLLARSTIFWSFDPAGLVVETPDTITMTKSFDRFPNNPDNPLSTISATVKTTLDPPALELFNSVDYSTASTGGDLRYYFNLEGPAGFYYPDGFKVPIMFASKAIVDANPLTTPTQGEQEHAIVLAAVALRIGQRTPDHYDIPLGTVDQLNAFADEKRITKEKTFVHVYEFIPFGMGWVSLSAVANVSNVGLNPYIVKDGEAYAYIDPMICVDPSFMVEHEGRMVPGSEIFSITFSEGIVNLPSTKPFNWGMFLPAIMGTQE